MNHCAYIAITSKFTQLNTWRDSKSFAALRLLVGCNITGSCVSWGTSPGASSPRVTFPEFISLRSLDICPLQLTSSTAKSPSATVLSARSPSVSSLHTFYSFPGDLQMIQLLHTTYVFILTDVFGWHKYTKHSLIWVLTL